jgi:neutral ceramidase
MFHYTLHTNTNFGPRFSGDYPAIVSARIRERFGPQVVTLFLPGACGDINTTGPRHRQVGDALAEVIIRSLENRRPGYNKVGLASVKKEVTVPRRDFTVDQEERILSSGWPPESQKRFRLELDILRKEGKKEDVTILQAWQIGEVGFASLPGELFVEWGLKIKKESPFRWTYPVELGGDYLGYMVTERAWQEGGYESLIARSARPKREGVEMMVEEALQMLQNLYKGDEK